MPPRTRKPLPEAGVSPAATWTRLDFFPTLRVVMLSERQKLAGSDMSYAACALVRITVAVGRIGAWLANHQVVLFSLWAGWLALEYYAFGPLSYLRIHDNGDCHIPARIGLARRGLAGLSSLWSPQVGGVDAINQIRNTEFDTLAFLLLPGWLAYAAVTWLQRFLAGYSLSLLLKQLGFGGIGGIYAGMFYAMFAQNSLNASWAGYTLYDELALPGLPLVLWALGRLAGSKHLRAAVLSTAIGLIYSYCSIVFLTLPLLPLILCWPLLVCGTPGGRRGFWRGALFFLIGWAAGEAIPLWSAFAVAAGSHRANWQGSDGLGSALFSAADLMFDNLGPLLLGIAGLALSRGSDGTTRRLLATAGFCVACVALYPSFQHLLGAHLGFLRGFQADRFSLLVPLLVGAAAASGLSSLRRATEKWRVSLTRTLSFSVSIEPGVLLVGLLIVTAVGQSVAIKRRTLIEMATGSNHRTLYEHPDLIALASSGEGSDPFRVATIPIGVVHPAQAWAQNLETADGYANLYPKRYQRFWELVITPVARQDEWVRNYFSGWGSRVYLFPPSGGFPDRSTSFEQYYDLRLLSLANVRYLISPIRLEERRLRLLPSADRARLEELQRKGKRAQLKAEFGGAFAGPPLFVYENLDVLPRFFLVSRVRGFASSDAVLEALRFASLDELRTVAFLERPLPPGLVDRDGDGAPGAIEIVTYFADRAALRVRCSRPAVLIISNSYSPQWAAWVDGAPQRVLPADFAFQGLPLPAGDHDVLLQYHLPDWRAVRN